MFHVQKHTGGAVKTWHVCFYYYTATFQLAATDWGLVMQASKNIALCIHVHGVFYNPHGFANDINFIVCSSMCTLFYTAENIKTLGPPPPGEHYDIIVLDGTWRQARDIFNNNPFLCQARQVSCKRESYGTILIAIVHLHFDVIMVVLIDFYVLLILAECCV